MIRRDKYPNIKFVRVYILRTYRHVLILWEIKIEKWTVPLSIVKATTGRIQNTFSLLLPSLYGLQYAHLQSIISMQPLTQGTPCFPPPLMPPTVLNDLFSAPLYPLYVFIPRSYQFLTSLANRCRDFQPLRFLEFHHIPCSDPPCTV